MVWTRFVLFEEWICNKEPIVTSFLKWINSSFSLLITGQNIDDYKTRSVVFFRRKFSVGLTMNIQSHWSTSSPRTFTLQDKWNKIEYRQDRYCNPFLYCNKLDFKTILRKCEGLTKWNMQKVINPVKVLSSFQSTFFVNVVVPFFNFREKIWNRPSFTSSVILILDELEESSCQVWSSWLELDLKVRKREARSHLGPRVARASLHFIPYYSVCTFVRSTGVPYAGG